MSSGWRSVLESAAGRAALAKAKPHRNPAGLLPTVPAAASAPRRRKARQTHTPLCGRHAGAPCDCGLEAARRRLEDLLAGQLRAAGVRSFRRSPLTKGIIPGRGFHPDFAFDEARLVVEVQGNAGGGRGPHGGFDKLTRDVEKMALLAAFGWRVLPCTGAMVESGEACRLTLAALAWRPAP